MRAKFRDTEIYFDVEGSSLVPDAARMVERPVMFALHGGPGGDHTNFKPALSPLANKVQIVYIDHRGQGRSARGPKETYTMDNNVEDVESLRQHLGLEKIVLFGSSYGGMVALSYATRYPDNVSHLIAGWTAPSHRFLERAKEIIAERGTPEQKTVTEKLWSGSFETEEELKQFYEVMGPLYSKKYDPEKNKERWGRATLSVDAINYGFSTFLRTYDVTDDLYKISCPTLVIAGRHDWICPPEFSELIASKIPKADLRIFEYSAHSILGDEPESFYDAVRGFLTYNY
jgi:proline iminopeptidase